MAEVNKAKSRLLAEVGTGTVEEALESAAGRRFVEIVRLCLSTGNKVKIPDDEEEDEEDRCIDLELVVLEKLRACSV